MNTPSPGHASPSLFTRFGVICLRGVMLACLLFLWLIFPAFALDNGPGKYIYHDPETGKAIPVWYVKPADFSATTPIVIVLHGVNRNAQSYRDSWQTHAERYGFMLLAPEFSEELFPGDAYAQGNYFKVSPADARKAKAAPRANPPELWSFRVPEKVFADLVSVREKTAQKAYYLYGHSAGAQFIHRMLEFLPAAKVKMAVIANAGWYTLPDLDRNWPYGLRGTAVDSDAVRRFFALPLVVLLGENDTDSRHAELRRTAKADEQGITRLERGRYFFSFGSDRARALGVSFGWRLVNVPEVSHSNKGMAGIAAELIAADAFIKE